MPVTSPFAQSVHTLVAQGKGDEIGRLGAHGDVKETAQTKGNAGQKIAGFFNKHSLEAKTEKTQNDFASKVISELQGKHIAHAALQQVDNKDHLQLDTQGRLLSISDDKISLQDAAKLLAGALDSPEEPEAPQLPPRQPQRRKPAGLKLNTAPAPTPSYTNKQVTEYLRDPDSPPAQFQKMMTGMLATRFGSDKAQAIMDHRSNHYDTSATMKGVCRYADIKPPKATLIVANGHHVNANSVTIGGKSMGIATQAPSATTVEAFWNMVEQNDIRTIVDLTNATDKTKKHIPDYRPEKFYKLQSNNTVVIRDRGDENAIYDNMPAGGSKDDIIATENYVLKTVTDDTKLQALNYYRWLDHGVIPLNDLTRTVDAIQNAKAQNGGNVLIHCTAGVGRTGTVFSALALKEMAQEGKLTAANVDDMMLQVIADGRDSRGGAFVQTKDQAKLVSDYAYTLVGKTHE